MSRSHFSTGLRSGPYRPWSVSSVVRKVWRSTEDTPPLPPSCKTKPKGPTRTHRQGRDMVFFLNVILKCQKNVILTVCLLKKIGVALLLGGRGFYTILGQVSRYRDRWDLDLYRDLVVGRPGGPRDWHSLCLYTFFPPYLPTYGLLQESLLDSNKSESDFYTNQTLASEWKFPGAPTARRADRESPYTETSSAGSRTRYGTPQAQAYGLNSID